MSHSSANIHSAAPAAIHGIKAFTLIEIMVVMLLISIILGVAVPRFDNGAFQDSQKTITRKIINIVSTLRAKSIAEQKTYALVIDVSNDRYWVVDESMDEIAMAQATEKALKLPDDIHFVDIQFPDQGQLRSGMVEIQFHPAGYADQALIHLQSDRDQRFTFQIEPLLPKMKTADEWLTY